MADLQLYRCGNRTRRTPSSSYTMIKIMGDMVIEAVTTGLDLAGRLVVMWEGQLGPLFRDSASSIFQHARRHTYVPAGRKLQRQKGWQWGGGGGGGKGWEARPGKASEQIENTPFPPLHPFLLCMLEAHVGVVRHLPPL